MTGCVANSVFDVVADFIFLFFSPGGSCSQVKRCNKFPHTNPTPFSLNKHTDDVKKSESQTCLPAITIADIKSGTSNARKQLHFSFQCVCTCHPSTPFAIKFTYDRCLSQPYGINDRFQHALSLQTSPPTAQFFKTLSLTRKSVSYFCAQSEQRREKK